MAKKHDTFAGEQEEMPAQPDHQEIEQPHDPKETEIPDQEIPDIPDELKTEGKR